LGLAGIAPVQEGGLLRPLLFARHGDLMDFAVREELPVCEDPSNENPAHRRNRLRHELLPALEQAFPGASRVLARQAGLFRGHAQLARRLLGKSLRASQSAGVLCFDRSPGPETFQEEELLVLLHQAVAAAGLGHGLEAGHLGLMLGLGPGEGLDLPGGLRAEAAGTQLFVFPGNSRGPAAPEAPLLLPDCGTSLPTALGQLQCLPWASLPSALDGRWRAVFKRDALLWPLRLRACKPGEVFQPWGAHAPKLCSDLLADAGIPKGLRSWPLLLEDSRGTQLWLLGCRRSRFLPVEPESAELVSLELQPRPLS
jgi:tRNA(Ile)-lysidine synthase